MDNSVCKLSLPIFIKIAKTEYIGDTFSGKLYMNNLKYFVDLEIKSKTKGIGDIREASLLNIKKHKMFLSIDNGDFKEIDLPPAPGIVYDNDALYHSVFCVMKKDIELSLIQEDAYEGSIKLSKENLKDFIEEGYSYHAVIIYNPTEFIKRFEQAAADSNFSWRSGEIVYRNKDLPNIQNGEWILDNTFTKDNYFSSQQEYRFELLNYAKDAITFDIGDITDISFMVNCEKLLTGLSVKLTNIN